MKKVMLTCLVASTLLFFNGCSSRVVYVPAPCPKLVQYDVNVTEDKPILIEYEVE